MGTDNHGFVFQGIAGLLRDIDTAGLEHFNCLWIMDERTERINDIFTTRFIEDLIHSFPHTHAEAGALCKLNFHDFWKL